MNGSTTRSRKKSKDTLKQMKIRTQQSTILLGHWEINNTLGTGKAILRGGFMALQAYLKKQGRVQINNLILHLNELEKEQQNNPK